ncbi:hypothetical protein, partial [Paraferrimonas haliotis]|uniref:hypothetical protein n=1 Tax=Paraferrimonas haliotis TaxID=2013866 RepID=UPI001C530D08
VLHQMSLNGYTGKLIKPWPILVDHYTDVELDVETEKELFALQSSGVTLAKCIANAHENSEIKVQITTPRKTIITIATSVSENLIPGSKWLNAGGLVVESTQLKEIKKQSFSILSAPIKDNALHGQWELTDELNGKLKGFGERFWMHLLESNSGSLLKVISNDPVTEISYSDRYQQNPVSLLLITEVLSALCAVQPSLSRLKINTLFIDREQPGYFLHQDWSNCEDYIHIFCKWIEFKTKVEPKLIVQDKRADIAHRRLLTLTLESNKTIKFKLDQGLGYWRLREVNSRYKGIKFDFEENEIAQLEALRNLESSVSVYNSEDWSTDISYRVVK